LQDPERHTLESWKNLFKESHGRHDIEKRARAISRRRAARYAEVDPSDRDPGSSDDLSVDTRTSNRKRERDSIETEEDELEQDSVVIAEEDLSTVDKVISKSVEKKKGKAVLVETDSDDQSIVVEEPHRRESKKAKGSEPEASGRALSSKVRFSLLPRSHSRLQLIALRLAEE
jgi:hypothetical protein